MTKSDRRVSVIMPIFNGESFLAEAIESVLKQTYSSWELIMVDDGSNDCSRDIAYKFTQQYPNHISLIYHPKFNNLGTPATRNLGIAHAHGEFIANIDQDDTWTTTKLEEQVAIMDNYPQVAMTFGPMLIWSSWDKTSGIETDKIQHFTFKLNTVFNPPDFVPLLLSGRDDPHGYLIRQSVIQSVGGYVENVGICEDWVLYIKIALKYPIYVTSNWNYRYRQHAGQTCSTRHNTGEFYLGFKPFFQWLKVYLNEQQCNEKRVLWAFYKAVKLNYFYRMREFIMHRGRRVILALFLRQS